MRGKKGKRGKGYDHRRWRVGRRAFRKEGGTRGGKPSPVADIDMRLREGDRRVNIIRREMEKSEYKEAINIDVNRVKLEKIDEELIGGGADGT